MHQVMMIITSNKGPPTLDEASQILNVPRKCLDERFGVVLTDPKDGLYTVLVEASAVSNVSPNNVEGPFSNPQIAHFGPTK